MKRMLEKHSRATRWLHWLNVPLLSVMIYSGLLIYWANPVYRIGWGEFTLVEFFPDWFFRVFALRFRLAEGMAWHFAVMWLFVANGVAYVSYTVWSGEWRHLVPNRHSFGEAWQVVLRDLGIRQGPLPPGKYNAAQKIAYSGVICMGAASVLTGVAIYKPIQLGWLVNCFGGYETARAIHFYLTLGYVLFICVHLVQVLRAGWNCCRSMLSGYEVETIPEPSHV